MELRRILAKNVLMRRSALRISQEELAHRAEIDRTWVSVLENAKSAVTIDVVERIARALEIDPAELMRSDGT